MPTFFGVAQLSPTDLNPKHSLMMMLSSVPTLSIRTTSHKLKHSHSHTSRHAQFSRLLRAPTLARGLSLSCSPDGAARSLSFHERAFLRCFDSSSFWLCARAHAEFFIVVNLLPRFQTLLALSLSLLQVSPAETLGLPLFFGTRPRPADLLAARKQNHQSD